MTVYRKRSSLERLMDLAKYVSYQAFGRTRMLANIRNLPQPDIATMYFEFETA